MIENEVFDCYASSNGKSIDNIIREMKGKTKKQSERLVLNLDGFDQQVVDNLIEAIHRKANPNQDLKRLKEVIFVKDRQVNQVFWRE
ncbi:CdiA C-terminal domain-containing protein [Enterococcus sp. LJL128]|uniref:CdiA C-terminal domain-containing protein n=1 Tax=Enterococcus sp. LJL51 TaxID=3416656 RepID=UPI003CE6E54A